MYRLTARVVCGMVRDWCDKSLQSFNRLSCGYHKRFPPPYSLLTFLHSSYRGIHEVCRGRSALYVILASFSIPVWGRSTSGSSCVQRHKKPRKKEQYTLISSPTGRLVRVDSIGGALAPCTSNRPSKVNQMYTRPTWRTSLSRQQVFRGYECAIKHLIMEGHWLYHVCSLSGKWSGFPGGISRGATPFLDFHSHYGAMTTWHVNRTASNFSSKYSIYH